MSKALSSWSGMRKYLEQEMLAEGLRGRVRYNCTAYPQMDGCRIFEIYIDNILVKQFSFETVNTYFTVNGLFGKKRLKKPSSEYEYWAGFEERLAACPPEGRTEYTDGEFCEALQKYRNQPVQKSISSENAVVKMFALLDRRIGLRTLERERDRLSPEWLRQFYKLRLDAEINQKGQL